ncbi:molybdenum ABC transporter substrate-binding protein [Variovorax sp. WS11]|uniref:substrate-binding domain-containing protein n=1 Tax=Variovorax sp. WS11 TaxID=1105204 RepID=UPI000D0D2677|nr:substrate-binding domain-containing protein [Variovorax sp. WS11]NDZ11929.1 ABC transporter substrate-binding protein [Variovorax sp. WS11]PSL82688.1 molybdenum ABC transporter substrate-binding protein [Variovorax sp. WS11]
MTYPPLRIISSMATRALLEELSAAYAQRTGAAVAVESAGGVEAARRVSAGEPFDAVTLASDAIDKLAAAGRVDAAGKVDLVRSGVGVAVPAGAARPDIATEDALRRAVKGAAGIGYSTGPSGVALIALFQRWGIAGELEGRLVQAPPGVPVGSLVARGDAALGFQQMSELLHVEGIDLLGPLPSSIQITTVFSAAPCLGSARRDAVRALLDFMASPDTAEAKRRHGMEAAS